MANRRTTSGRQSKTTTRKKTTAKKETPIKVSSTKNKKSFSWQDFLLGRRSTAGGSAVSLGANDPVMRFIPFLSVLVIFVALLAAYTLGAAQNSVCKVVYKPNVGTFKYLTIEVPKNSFFSNLFQTSSQPVNPSQLQQQHNLYLVDAQGQTYKVLANSSINLAQLDNKTVILTGAVDPCNHTVTLDSLQNIQSLVSPQPAQ